MADETEKSGLEKRLQMRRADQTMNRTQGAGKKQQKDNGEILVDHLRENGQILCISDDETFIGTLRDLIANVLKMPASCLNISTRPDMAGKLCRQYVEAKRAPLVLVEQTLDGRDLTFAVRLLKNTFPELKVLMLSQETDRQHLALMHESGVDYLIIKPVDSSGLLEKMARTIRPNEQLERTLTWAKTLLAQGEHLRALQICTQALEQQPGSYAIFLLMGDIFKAMKEYDKAIDAYGRAQATSNINLEPLSKLAELHAERGNANKHIEFLEKMDEISPLNLERKILIGELYLKMNKTDNARKTFERAMKLSNRQARENVSNVAYRVADIYANSDPLTAASFLQRGLDARKEFWGHEDIVTFNRLGLLLRRSGKWEEAANEYRKAIGVAPNDEILHYNLAMACFEGKDMEKARASALKAMALKPELPRRSSRIAANLAAVFMGVNDKMHALPLLRSALEQDPKNPEALELMSRIERDEGGAS